MSFFYNLIYSLTLLVASPWIAWKALSTGKYRDGWLQKLWGQVPRRTSDRSCIWFHAVSVGEVNLLVRLRSEWHSAHPDWDVVVSTTTLTGMKLAQERFKDDLIVYCPLDFSWAVRRAFNRLRPDLFVLAELEIWPNLLARAKRNRVPLAIVNGRLSDNSFRGYQRIHRLVRSWFSAVEWIGAQDKESAERFRTLAPASTRVEVTGSLKFDRAESDRDNPKTRQLANQFHIEPSSFVWVVGSTQDPEESMTLQIYQDLVQAGAELKLILVPRHAERFQHVCDLARSSSLSWVRRTEVNAEATCPSDWQVLVVDTIGELGAWWGVADVAYVGGSMGSRGGQNMIEPAAYGAAVSFGPNTRNFRDVVKNLLRHEAARQVQNETELHDFVRECLEGSQAVSEMGNNARRFVASQQGATLRTRDGLEALLEHRETNVGHGCRSELVSEVVVGSKRVA